MHGMLACVCQPETLKGMLSMSAMDTKVAPQGRPYTLADITDKMSACDDLGLERFGVTLPFLQKICVMNSNYSVQHRLDYLLQLNVHKQTT